MTSTVDPSTALGTDGAQEWSPQRFRAEFAGLSGDTYLISACLGPLPERSRRYLDSFFDTWSARAQPDEVWDDVVFPAQARVRALLAGLVGAHADEVAIVPNISIGLSTVASFLDYTERPTIVVGELDVPTGHHVWYAQDRRGARVHRVPSRNGMFVETEDYLAAIDERTALVQINRVVSPSGAVVDVREVAARAHEVGAYVLVDDIHGTGVVPIDVWATGADFYTSGTLKWLCGGGGTAFLLVRRDLIARFQSQVTGWWANRPESHLSHDRDLADDARRFESGTFAGAPTFLALGGLELMAEIGVDRIRERQIELTGYVIERADAAGIPVATPRDPAQRGGLVRLSTPDPAATTLALKENGVAVDWRPGGIRVSPHYFNDHRDIDTLFAALAKIS